MHWHSIKTRGLLVNDELWAAVEVELKNIGRLMDVVEAQEFDTPAYHAAWAEYNAAYKLFRAAELAYLAAKESTDAQHNA